MRIAISANGNDREDLFDVRFGRCEYFQIYDTESNKVLSVENEGLDCTGGAGIKASQQLVEYDVNIIITGNLGPNAFEVIEKAGIKAYKCEKTSVKVALERFKNDELEEITFAAPAHNGMV